jgi:cytochrome c5
MDENAVAARIKPVGEVNLAGAGGEASAAPSMKQASAAPAAKSGEQVYQSICGACHGAGLLGSPKLGDKAAWKQRLAQGSATLYDHAIKGIRTMPPKGGNTALTDGEVKAAVDYMAGKSK